MEKPVKPGRFIGQASAGLLLRAALGALSGLWNLIFGRRNWLLMVSFLAMFVVFVVANVRGSLHVKAG